MARKKAIQETQAPTEKKQARRRKKQEDIHCTCTDAEIAKTFIEDVESVKELLEPVKEVPEQVYIWQEGDDIDKVAEKMTGKSWKKWALLNYSEVNASDLKPGTILKWRL